MSAGRNDRSLNEVEALKAAFAATLHQVTGATEVAATQYVEALHAKLVELANWPASREADMAALLREVLPLVDAHGNVSQSDAIRAVLAKVDGSAS